MPKSTSLSLLRSLLPPSLRRTASLMRILNSRERTTHVRLKLQRFAGLRRDVLPVPPEKIRTLLFVCTGNIIRSPFSAALARQILTESTMRRSVQVMSAGLIANTGRSADPRVLKVAGEYGLSLAEHRSSAATAAMLQRADVVLVMDEYNEAVLLARQPDAARKVLMLGAFGRLPGGEPLEIADPYTANTAAVRSCCERLNRAVRALLGQIAQG